MALSTLKPPVGIEWHQRQRFPQNMPDDEWLEIVGKKGWFVFSHDRKFHSESTEAAAIKQHGIGCFYLPRASGPLWDKLIVFVRTFEKLGKIAATEGRPYVYDVGANFRIRKLKL
jgi:hypothetical protein